MRGRCRLRRFRPTGAALLRRRRRRLEALVEASLGQLRFEPFLRARDREALVVQKLPDARDDSHFALGVGPGTRLLLSFGESGKLRLPVAENVGRDFSDLARFGRLVELLRHEPRLTLTPDGLADNDGLSSFPLPAGSLAHHDANR